MIDPIRIGVVGGGLVAQAIHLPLLSSLPDTFHVAGLAEPSASLRSLLAKRHGIEAPVEHWRELVERGDLDALVVATPNATHGEIVLAALEAGQHVLVEKPMCLSESVAEQIVATARAVDRVVQVGYMKRYDDAFAAFLAGLHEAGSARYLDVVTYDPGLEPLFDAGEIVRATDIPPDTARGLADAQRAQVLEATGASPAADHAFSHVFMGALIHDVNLVQGALEALGDELPTEAQNARHWADGRAGSLEFVSPGGIPCSVTWLQLPNVGDFRELLRVHADDAVHELEFGAPYSRVGQRRTVYRRRRGDLDRHTTVAVEATSNCFVNELVHFARCVRGEASCPTPPEQAARDQALLTHAFRLSCARRRYSD